MTHIIISLCQIFIVIWPVILFIAGFMMIYGPGGFRGLIKRLRSGLLVTWLVLLVIWVIAQFGPQPNLGLLPEPTNTLLFFGGLFVLLAIEFYPVLHKLWVNQHRLDRITLIQDLKRLEPGQFEELVAVTYRALGFWVRRTGKSGDHGVDLEMWSSNGNRWIVQCKRYRDTVGEPLIRDLYGTLLHEKAHRAVMVTSAEITPPAEKWASGKPIDLVDGHQLLKLMEKARRRVHGNFIQKFVWRIQDWWKPQAKGIPVCPRCHAPMQRRPARLTDHPSWVLYQCTNYPRCRVVLEYKDISIPHHPSANETLYNN